MTDEQFEKFCLLFQQLMEGIQQTISDGFDDVCDLLNDDGMAVTLDIGNGDDGVTPSA